MGNLQTIAQEFDLIIEVNSRAEYGYVFKARSANGNPRWPAEANYNDIKSITADKVFISLDVHTWANKIKDESDNINLLLHIQTNQNIPMKTLKDYFKTSKKPIQSNEIGGYLLQIVDIVKQLHFKFIFHSNLNTKKIFIDIRNLPRSSIENINGILIGGFEFYQKLTGIDERLTLATRQPYYSCNEIEKRNFGLKYDIWCIGLILYEMLFRKDAEEDLLKKNLSLDWDKKLPSIDEDYEKTFKKTFKSLLQSNYTIRESLKDMQAIKEYRIIFEEQWSNLKQKKENEEIIKKNYKIIECLNMDTQKFYLAYDEENKKHVVIKFKRTSLNWSREIDLLKDIFKGKDYIMPYNSDFKPFIDFHCIVFDYSDNGCLKNYLYKLKSNPNQPFEPRLLHRWIGQLIEGISCIHSLPVLIRNIKPSNLIICGDINNHPLKTNIKYTDLQIIREFATNVDNNSFCQNINVYSSPEYINSDHKQSGNMQFCIQSDIW